MSNAARNAISRNRSYSMRAAELYDDGATDAAVAKALREEFSCRVSARTARSFRLRDYEPVRAARLERMEDAQSVRMLMSAAEDSGTTFAGAAQDLYARLMYDMIKEVRAGGAEMDPKVLLGIGKQIAKFNEVQLAQAKFELDQEKVQRADDVKSSARANPELDAKTREMVLDLMDEKMLGVKK